VARSIVHNYFVRVNNERKHKALNQCGGSHLAKLNKASFHRYFRRAAAPASGNTALTF